MGTAEPIPVTTSAPTPDAVTPVAQTPTPAIEETPVLVPPEPDRLMGLNPKQVQALMGEPSLVRRDASVQIMLFETPSCVFEIVFYEPNPDAHFLTDQLNARSRSGTDIDLQACLVSLLPNGQWLDVSAYER